MTKLKLHKDHFDVNTIIGQKITIDRSVGVVTARLSDITYSNTGFNDLVTVPTIRIDTDEFKISKRKLFLGAVNPEIPLEGLDLRSYICSYSENNLWIQFKFKIKEDK